MWVRVLGIVALAYGIGAAFEWIKALTWMAALITVWATVCGIGLIFHLSWGSRVWYGFAWFMSASWTWSMIGVIRQGLWPDPSLLASVLERIPETLVLLICGFGSLAVARQYRRSKKQAS